MQSLRLMNKFGTPDLIITQYTAFPADCDKKYLTEMNAVPENVGENTRNVGENDMEAVPTVVSKNEIDSVIVEAIMIDKFVAITKLTQLTGRTSRTIERHLRALQNNSIIKREGPDKGGYWEVLK